MNTICGANCSECDMRVNCKGCVETDGCPFGEKCFIAQYITTGGNGDDNTIGKEKFEEFKQKLIAEFNELEILGMPKVTELYALVGSFVNMEYILPGGQAAKFLDDNQIYLGNQLACEFGGDRCFGIVAGMDFLIVCEYGKGGAEPELVMYKRR